MGRKKEFTNLIRHVYLDNDGHKFYETRMHGVYCGAGNSKKKEILSGLIVSDHYEIYTYLFLPDKKGILKNRKRIIEDNSEEGVSKKYRELLDQSKRYQAKEIIDPFGFVLWFNRRCSTWEKYDPDIFKPFSIRFCKSVVLLMMHIYGKETQLESVFEEMEYGFYQDILKYDRESIENINIETKLVMIADSRSQGVHRTPLLKGFASECVRCMNLILKKAKESNEITKFNLLKEKNGNSVAKNRKQKARSLEFDDMQKLHKVIIKHFEEFRGVEYTLDNQEVRLCNLVISTINWHPQRKPFFLKHTIDRLCLREPVPFPQSPWDTKTMAESITLDLILPHVDRDGTKGYGVPIIPPPLFEEYYRLNEFVQSFKTKNQIIGEVFTYGVLTPISDNGQIKYTSNPITEKLINTTFNEMENEAGITNPIGLYKLKHAYYSDSYKGKNGSETLLKNRMKVLNNKILKIVKDNYQTAKVHGIPIDPQSLSTQMDDLERYMASYDEYIQQIYGINLEDRLEISVINSMIIDEITK